MSWLSCGAHSTWPPTARARRSAWSETRAWASPGWRWNSAGWRGIRATVIVGRCLSYGASIPYLPLFGLVRNACGIIADDAADLVRSRSSCGSRDSSSTCRWRTTCGTRSA